MQINAASEVPLESCFLFVLRPKRYFLLYYVSGPLISIQIRCSGILIFMMYIRI